MPGNDDELDRFPMEGDFTCADLRGVTFPYDLRYSEMSGSFLIPEPLDFDPDLGVRESEEVISEVNPPNLGLPTEAIGRDVCTKDWPNLRVADALSERELWQWKCDLSDRTLIGSDFSGAYLWGADFSESYLENSDFTDATLWMADFSDSELCDTDFIDADLREADFSGADLRGTDFSRADIRGIDLSDVVINGETHFGGIVEHDELSSIEWSYLAQSYHSVKKLYSDHGITGKARTLKIIERRTRGLEVKSREGWRSPSYIGNQSSRILTGYGVEARYLLSWMMFLFVICTGWYVLADVESSLARNISYSAITFTTAMPHIPSGRITQFVAITETFFGTLFTILLGYILGSRESL